MWARAALAALSSLLLVPPEGGSANVDVLLLGLGPKVHAESEAGEPRLSKDRSKFDGSAHEQFLASCEEVGNLLAVESTAVPVHCRVLYVGSEIKSEFCGSASVKSDPLYLLISCSRSKIQGHASDEAGCSPEVSNLHFKLCAAWLAGDEVPGQGDALHQNVRHFRGGEGEGGLVGGFGRHPGDDPQSDSANSQDHREGRNHHSGAGFYPPAHRFAVTFVSVPIFFALSFSGGYWLLHGRRRLGWALLLAGHLILAFGLGLAVSVGFPNTWGYPLKIGTCGRPLPTS